MDTVNFLKSFNHSVYTVAVLSKKGMRSFPIKQNALPKALQTLKKYNDSGSDIYFTPNEGSGEWNDERKVACHSTKNIINLTSIFLDLELADGSDPIPALTAFCKDSFLKPSHVIETSKNRYHVYWVLESVPATKENVTKWQQVQALLHAKLSSDRTMTDIPQLLRIPDFTNQKHSSVVKLKHSKEYTYTLTECYDLLKNQFPEITTFKPFTPLTPTTPDYLVPPGERHEELLRRARKLYTAPFITDEDVKCYIHGFIQSHVQDSSTFLPGGSRYQEVTRILEAAKSYAEASRLEEQQTAVTQAITKTTSKKTPFELDPDFFYQAPGIVGELTRHIVDTSDYPIPSHAFAAAVSITGFCKARYIHGDRNLPPLNYFLCLAPSGAGKTSIQHQVKNIFSELQINHLLEDGIASGQGVLQFLANSNGLGFIIYDEVKDLFQTIQSKNSYEVKISTELTKLYTAYSSTYTPPTTKTHKGNKVILNKPLFSFLGYGHFSLVEQLFTKQNVLEGLIPRFIILNVPERKQAPDSFKYRSVPSHIIDYLRFHTVKSCLTLESPSDDIPIDTDPKRSLISLDPNTIPVFQSFKKHTDSLYDQAVTEKTGLEALYSRGVEQSLRLSLAMSSPPYIDLKTIEYTTHLISQQMQGFYTKFQTVVDQTPQAKQNSQLYDKIVDLCSNSSDYTISKRDLFRLTSRWFKDSNEFQRQIDGLKLAELIEEFTVSMPSGRKSIRIKLDNVD